MAVTYKDIDDLSQKSMVAGTEKLPVSDTQYITPEQIATSKRIHLTDESDMPASPDSNTLYLIDDDGSGQYTLPIASASTLGGVKVGSGLSINSTTGVLDATGGSANIVHLEDESEMPVSPDSDTLYVIDETPGAFEETANKVTSLSSSSTNTQYPSAKCVYDLIGDIETIINAL